MPSSSGLVRSRTWHAKSPSQLRLEADLVRVEAHQDRLRHEMRADARLLRDLDRHSHHHRRRFSSPLLAPATDPWLVAQAAAVAATTAIPRSPRRYGHYPVSPLASVGFGAPLQSPVYLPASPYIDTTLGPHSIYIPHDPLHNGLRDREYQMALAGEQRERRLAMADWRGETRAREIHQLQRLEEEAILDQAAVRAATAYTAARSPYLRAPEYGYPAGSPYIGEGMHRPGILSSPLHQPVGMPLYDRYSPYLDMASPYMPNLLPAGPMRVPLATPRTRVIDPVLL